MVYVLPWHGSILQKRYIRCVSQVGYLSPENNSETFQTKSPIGVLCIYFLSLSLFLLVIDLLVSMANILVAKVVGGVASGIGLVSEGISAKKRRSAMKKDNAEYNDDIAGPSQPPSYDEVLDEGDEEKWDLDDAQDELERAAGPGPQSPAGKPIRNVHKLTDAFMARHPVPEYIDEAPKLQLPVVLPQRRPKDRRRGFIRAYAPALETKGIDQATFLEFIETFDKASQASPWIQAINLAGFATIALAPPFSILVSIAIQTTVNVATEVHSRTRSKYLSPNTFSVY